MSLSAAEAAAELLKRREARRDLAAWARYNCFEPAKHHKLIIEQLEKVSRGEVTRLIILISPGTAKALALATPIPTPTG